MNFPDLSIWKKYTMAIEKAVKYFHVGEKKLWKLAQCCFYKRLPEINPFFNVLLCGKRTGVCQTPQNEGG